MHKNQSQCQTHEEKSEKPQQRSSESSFLIVTSANGEKMIEPNIKEIIPLLNRYPSNPINNYHINELNTLLSECANHENPNPFFKNVVKSMNEDDIRYKIQYHIDEIGDVGFCWNDYQDLANLCCKFLYNTHPLSIELKKSFQLPIYDSIRFDNIFRRFCHGVFVKKEIDYNDFAQLVCDFYKCRFVCSCYDNGIYAPILYEFKDYKWTKASDYKTLLQTVIISQFVPLITSYCSDSLDLTNCRKLMKFVQTCISNTNVMKNIIDTCMIKFYDRYFATNLNSDKHLLGFKNGVFDLNEQRFRDALPWDYVTMSVGYDWKEFDSMDPLFVQTIEKFRKILAQIQTEDEIVTYLLMFIAQILSGVSDEKIHIWYGKGNNGKSAFLKMIHKLLGDYFGCVDGEFLMVKAKHWMKAQCKYMFAEQRGKRFIALREWEYCNQTLDIKKMIYCTMDNEMPPSRYEQDYKPCFNTLIICNDRLDIIRTKQSILNKVEMVPFDSEFVDTYQQIQRPGQFLKNQQICEEFKELVQPVMWLILRKYYPMYKNDGIQVPEKVSKFAKNNNMLNIKS